MTIENSNNRDRLTSDGIIVDFDFTFKIYDDTQIEVYTIDNDDAATIKTLTTDYTVAISTTTEGGTVTYVTSPADTYEVLMIRAIPYTQSADIPVNEGFSEVIIENALDRLAIQIQQINDIISKTIRIEDTSSVTGLTFGDPESEKLIRWKDDLSGFENILLTDTSVIEADITIASGDAKKVVNVNAAETGYELNTIKTLIELITSGLTINSILKNTKGADVASTGTLTLGDDGNLFDITGTTNITSITAKTAGTIVVLQFDGVLTVTDGSNLSINGDLVTAAGNTLTLVSDGTNWIELSRTPPMKADGSTLEISSTAMQLKDGGTTAAKLAAVVASGVLNAWINFNGTGIVEIRDSFNVTSITDNGTGDYTVTWDTDFADVNYVVTGLTGNAGDNCFPNIHTVVAGSFRLMTTNVDGAEVDSANVHLMAIGTQ